MMAARKRLRVGVTKTEKLDSVREELEVLAVRLQVGGAADAITNTITTLRQITPLKDQIAEMSSDMAKDLASSVATSSHNTDNRIALVSKQLYGANYKQLAQLEQRIVHARTSLETAASLAIMTSFGATDTGNINWKQMHKTLMKRVADEDPDDDEDGNMSDDL